MMCDRRHRRAAQKQVADRIVCVRHGHASLSARSARSPCDGAEHDQHATRRAREGWRGCSKARGHAQRRARAHRGVGRSRSAGAARRSARPRHSEDARGRARRGPRRPRAARRRSHDDLRALAGLRARLREHLARGSPCTAPTACTHSTAFHSCACTNRAGTETQLRYLPNPEIGPRTNQGAIPGGVPRAVLSGGCTGSTWRSGPRRGSGEGRLRRSVGGGRGPRVGIWGE